MSAMIASWFWWIARTKQNKQHRDAIDEVERGYQGTMNAVEVRHAEAMQRIDSLEARLSRMRELDEWERMGATITIDPQTGGRIVIFPVEMLQSEMGLGSEPSVTVNLEHPDKPDENA